jgi:hypothetical protein
VLITAISFDVDESTAAAAAAAAAAASVKFQSPCSDNELGFCRLFFADKSVVDVFGV